jgi:tetratricopeptide (TPR) repeat protein
MAPEPDDIDELSEQIVNPRPSQQAFASLKERTKRHDDLCREGRKANAAGQLEKALACFEEAYPLIFKSSTVISLVNMRLKLGDGELCAACYRKILDSESLPPAERQHASAKLREAKSLAKAVSSIIDVPQAGRFSSPEQRKARHAKLQAEAKQAHEASDFTVAADKFVQAWPLLYRPSTLVSAANMLLRSGRARLAAGLYYRLLRLELSEQEEAVTRRKLAQARQRLEEQSQQDTAARFVQRLARGRIGRKEARGAFARAATSAMGRGSRARVQMLGEDEDEDDEVHEVQVQAAALLPRRHLATQPEPPPSLHPSHPGPTRKATG